MTHTPLTRLSVSVVEIIVVIPLAVVVPVIVEDVLVLAVLPAVRGAAAVGIGIRILVRCALRIL